MWRFRGKNSLILGGNYDMCYYPVWQEDATLQDISIGCSYYSASLLKEECCKLLPLSCSYSHLLPELSRQGTVAVVTPGPTDWLSYLWQRPNPGSGLSFSECVGCTGRGGWARNEGSFSLTNTVTQLTVKWVTSFTQTVPLLSTSVPPRRRCDYVTGTLVI